MNRQRHSDENRVRPGTTPPRTRRLVEWYRRRATRRTLLLLECGIIRHAPFADCGRPLWDLVADQPWFETAMPPAEWLRLRKATGGAPESLGSDRSWPVFPMNAHHAIRWLEQHADDPDADRLLLAEEYVRHAEWSAEARMFNPEDRRDEDVIGYGAASWLLGLGEVRPGSWNILDSYLGDFPGTFSTWVSWRPIHPGHRPAAIGLIEDILWHPLSSVRFDAAWRTREAVEIASTMYETRDFTAAPILADALEDAGCDSKDILNHCRSGRTHCRGCWVVDRVLGKT
ncbi:hypothetical protein EP7_002065 [Isosphaeraceae bacterium EP7]